MWKIYLFIILSATQCQSEAMRYPPRDPSMPRPPGMALLDNLLAALMKKKTTSTKVIETTTMKLQTQTELKVKSTTPFEKCPDKHLTPNFLKEEWEGQCGFIIRWDPGPLISATTRSNQSIVTAVDFYCKLRNRTTNSYSSAPICKIVDVNLTDNWSRIELLQYENSHANYYTLIGNFTDNSGCRRLDSFNFQSLCKPSNINYIVYSTFGVTGFVVFIIIGSLVIWKWEFLEFGKVLVPKRCRTTPIAENHQDPSYSLIPIMRHSNYYMQLDDYEFPRSKIELEVEIGRGAFGFVYSAKAHDILESEPVTMVAVKFLGDHKTKENVQDFANEIEIFKKIGHHPNIVKLLKCVTVDQPFMMVMEFVPCGDLKRYLLELRQQWFKRQDPEYSTTNARISIRTLGKIPYALETILDHKELQSFALQIALGMAHLEKIPITHRDLAARNILINEHKQLKISDFGLSRRGIYTSRKMKKVPVRWTAPEALAKRKYDSKSDVWSFGVVLWEVATLGAFPYKDMPSLFILNHLQLGKRLRRPEICTDFMYLTMMRCWAENPEERPTFRDLVEDLDDRKRQVYMDFGHLNPGYVFPPADH